MRISSKEKLFIAKANVARVATVGLDGMPHVVPVCPCVENTKIYFASEARAAKVENLKRDSAIAVVFDEYRDSWRALKGVMFRGHAKIVDRQAFNRIRAKLYQKYPKYKTDAALEYGESCVIVITVERKFSWGFES